MTLTVHLDAVGGIAGDMFAAALLDARPDLRERVLADAASVLPGETGTPELAETSNGGLRALRFGLGNGASVPHRHGPADHYEHGHAHGHDHRHAGDHGHPAGHHHGDAGSFRDMVERIRSAPLHDGTAAHAVAILTLIAEAEAAIHRVPVETVHFHEIADWDSLLDVVAAGSIAAALDGARWSVSPLPRGGGLVRTQHGLLPVPAPATAALLTGFAWRDDGVPGERVTPTGAAILRHLVEPARPHNAGGVLQAVGTGAGSRTLPGLPNVLRALVFSEAPAAAEAEHDQVAVIAFEIDDMTGEEIAVAAERLRGAAGVLDLSLGLRQGKKGRAMQAFRLLVRPDHADAVAARCFAETSTIGLRLRREDRLVLRRSGASVTVGGRAVGLKRVRRPGGEETVKAESDDVGAETLAGRRRLKRSAEEAAET